MRNIILIISLLSTLISNAQKEKWLSYTNKSNVTCIEIENNKVWIGSKNGVQVRDLTGKLLKEYTKSDGLTGNNVTCMAIDVQGNKWFGTYNGVSELLNNGVGVEEQTVESNEVKIMPHPLIAESVLKFNNNQQQKVNIKVYDITGKQVYQNQTTANTFNLNRNLFNAAGLYIYQIKFADSSSQQGKLMVK